MAGRIFRVVAALGAGIFCGSLGAATVYFETNLVSDIPGLAGHTDPNLKNPWGMSFNATSPFWVSNQGSNNSTLYSNPGPGTPQALIVTMPPGPGPTGQVFANIAGNFLLPGTAAAPTPTAATFIFDTLAGTIAGWNAAQGNPVGTAVTEFTATDGAVFTGLAINTSTTAPLLYAADFANGRIDVFNSSFTPMTLPGTPFRDPNLPAGYSPYNVQLVAGKLYVEYAKLDTTTGRPTQTANTGVVDVFNQDGSFAQRLVTNTDLNSPWGVTQAPAGFGTFGGDILVGNFGDGTISAYDPVTGAFVGMISGPTGQAIVNSGLWAINFRAAGSGFDPNTLFLTAGINNEADGLFAEIQLVPEPSTFVMLALAAVPVALLKARRQKS